MDRALELQIQEGFELVRDFEAPRPLVYQAWTDPALVALWWGIEGASNPVCELDVRPGGEWRIDMQVPSGTTFPNRGVYEVVEPDARLVFRDLPIPDSPAWGGAPPGPIRHVVEFADLPGGRTRVTLRVTMDTEKDCRRLLEMGFKAGVEQSLDRAEKLVRSVQAQTVSDAGREP